MEVAVIDWKRIDSRFVRDDLYENINAPQWVDFSAPDVAIDDESWFCRPDCNHPKTLEDFYKETAPNSKRSANVLERLPFGERSRRDAALKKRGYTHASASPNKDLKCGRIVEDSENENPNFSTPPNYKARFLKEAFKSSADKKQNSENTFRKEPPRSLRSTLSARNLFAGGNILNKVTEFCNELKKLAMRSKDRENMEDYAVNDNLSDDSENLGDKEKERKPLLEVRKEQSEAQQKSNSQEKARRKKRYDDVENTPITVDVENVKRKVEQNLLPIRTCPPTPQCFSANRGPPRNNQLKPRAMERGILQELGQRNMDTKKDEAGGMSNFGGHASIVAEKEAKAIDVFWFLKPCTLSNQAV